MGKLIRHIAEIVRRAEPEASGARAQERVAAAHRHWWVMSIIVHIVVHCSQSLEIHWGFIGTTDQPSFLLCRQFPTRFMTDCGNALLGACSACSAPLRTIYSYTYQMGSIFSYIYQNGSEEAKAKEAKAKEAKANCQEKKIHISQKRISDFPKTYAAWRDPKTKRT